MPLTAFEIAMAKVWANSLVIIVATGALDVANNDIAYIDATIVIRTDGASGTLVASGIAFMYVTLESMAEGGVALRVDGSAAYLDRDEAIALMAWLSEATA